MKYSKVFIESFGYELAPNVVTSDDLEKQLEPVYQLLHFQKGQLESLTGISERRFWEPGYKVSQGAIAAGQKAIASSNIAPEDIGMLIYGGVCRDNLEPATACAADPDGDKCRTDARISETYGVGIITVGRTRKRFVEEGSDIAVRGKKREISEEKVPDGNTEAYLIALRCGEPPPGYANRTLRLLSDRMVGPEYAEHISYESVRQILKKTNRNPVRQNHG